MSFLGDEMGEEAGQDGQAAYDDADCYLCETRMLSVGMKVVAVGQ